MTADVSAPAWSPGQLRALEAVEQWLEHSSGKQVFRLFGYAGTGKTTLARHLTAGLDVRFGAYTGKAALVMRRAGCAGARTLHSMIYRPKPKSSQRLRDLKLQLDEARARNDQARLLSLIEAVAREEHELRRPSFEPNPDADFGDADLIVVDEVSMVGARLAGDLLSFGVPVLALGDPAQLPPVRDGGWFTNAEPDVLLTEIHRQAAGNPIIATATRIRRGEDVPYGELGGGSRVVPRGTVPIEELIAEHDQVLVGLNATRRGLNRAIRRVLKFADPLPEPGDRVICCRNDREVGLLNGQQLRVEARRDGEDGALDLDLVDVEEGRKYDGISVARGPFEGREPPGWPGPLHFEFAYAITCHKAQGSQWPRVAIVDESGAFRGDAARWRYTAVTRAVDRVTISR